VRGRFQTESTYIHQLIDEYRWTVPRQPDHHIFVGDATSPINISALYSSVAWPHQRIYETDQSQIGLPIFVGDQTKPTNINCIHWFRVPTNILELPNEPSGCTRSLKQHIFFLLI
jgi:hypothetical protein